MKRRFQLIPSSLALAATAFAFAPPVDARVTHIVVDSQTSVTNPANAAQPYVELTGRAWGELDPRNHRNSEITDLEAAAKSAGGKAPYIASWRIRMPASAGFASRVMWHDVPNRGGNVALPPDSFGAGDLQLLSGWQGDNTGGTVVPKNANCVPDGKNADGSNHYAAPCAAPTFANHYVVTPVLTGVKGTVLGRIINKPFGPATINGQPNPNANATNQPLNVMGNPIPYFPADSSDNSKATLKVHLSETINGPNGTISEGETISNSNWKFCYGPSATFAAPNWAVPSLPVRVCLGNGVAFDAKKLYQVAYEVKDPYVLGAGTAAFRDVQAFFKREKQDDFGNANPVAGMVRWAIIRGVSQSGNFTRHYLHLGMNEDESGHIVHEGAWPLIAGRRVANNSRWGQPDGVLELYQMGSEGPQWWHEWPDRVRDLPTRGILDRCEHSHTCPKIVETFGGAEVFALKMTMSWVGTSADRDIPLPKNVRRYYLPSSTHGGGNGATTQSPEAAGAVSCPGNNWGKGTLRANPVPSTALVNRMRLALRDWVTNGTKPPPSQWPTLRELRNGKLVGDDGDRDDDDAEDERGKGHEKHEHSRWQPTLVDATKKAMDFPSGVPGIPDSIFLPGNFIFPVFDYNWGPQYDHSEANGVPTNAPPPIRHVIKMLVPRVDADGNELGGVPTVQVMAPLATYLGWNITAASSDVGYDGRPFHAGQVCNYVGGMVPLFKTKAERTAAGDPRLSLEERYATHAGYVAAVRKAADSAACQGYLNAGKAAADMGAKCTTALGAGVADDWAALVNQAADSDVLCKDFHVVPGTTPPVSKCFDASGP